MAVPLETRNTMRLTMSLPLPKSLLLQSTPTEMNSLGTGSKTSGLKHLSDSRTSLAMASTGCAPVCWHASM